MTLTTPAPPEDLIENPRGAQRESAYSLSMPLMLFGGLSERWLLKESGDVHWNMLCEDLQTPSGELADVQGERLYASFMRVRIEATDHLQTLRENDRLDLSASLSRFGNKRFYSLLEYRSGARRICCTMNTVFTSREADNKSLARSRPKVLDASTCHVHAFVPPFGQGYHLVKEAAFTGSRSTPDPLVSLCGVPFEFGDGDLFSCEYTINPYHDLNGVNLLYFASYPRINDVCERVYVQRLAAERGVAEDWALSAAPLARDVFYYGNADLGDTIVFRLSSCEFLDGNVVKLHSVLTRKHDGFRMADIFTLKQLARPSSEYAALWRA